MEVLKKLKGIFSSETLRIILIEDAAIAAESIAKMLLDISPSALLHVPKSYNEVKECLKNGTYDLVLLDNSLTSWSDAAGMSGIKTIPLIKETNPQAFILFISNEIGVGKILMQEGMVDFWKYKNELEGLFEELKTL